MSPDEAAALHAEHAERDTIRCSNCGKPCSHDLGRNKHGDIIHAHGCPARTTLRNAQPRRQLNGGTKRALFGSSLRLLATNPRYRLDRERAHDGDTCTSCHKPIHEGQPKLVVVLRLGGQRTGEQFHAYHLRD